MFSSKFLSSSFLLIAAAVLMAPVALHATPVTYDLTLTETAPTGVTTYSGTGSVTLDVPGGLTNYVGYLATTGLVSLEFTIDGQTFNMSDPQNQGNSTVGFMDFTTGGIWDVTYAETNANGYRLTANGNQYIFYVPFNNPVSGTDWTGTFTAALAPLHSDAPPVPEPSSIALLGTGLFAGVGGLYRRIKAARA